MIDKFRAKFLNTGDKKRLFANFFSLSALQIFGYILPLITLPYLVRVLGVDAFGLLAFAAAFAAYFWIVVDFGFGLIAVREVAIHRENRQKVSEIFSSVMSIQIVLTLFCFVVLNIILFSFEKFASDFAVYYLSFGVVVGQMLFPQWLFQGMERMKYITYLNILSKLIFTACIFIFVTEKSDYYLVPLLTSLGYIVAGVWSMMIIKREFGVSFTFQDAKTINSYLQEAKHIFLSNAAISLYTVSTTFILGIFTNNTTVGYFAAADKIIQAFKGLMAPVSQAIYPFMSKQFSVSKQKGFDYIGIISKYITIFTLLLSVFIFVCSEKISVILLGEGFNSSIVLIEIMSVLPMIIALSNLYAVQGLYALGCQKVVSRFVAAVGMVHILYSTIAMYFFGAEGAAVSIVVTEILITIFSIIKFNKIKKGKNETIHL